MNGDDDEVGLVLAVVAAPGLLPSSALAAPRRSYNSQFSFAAIANVKNVTCSQAARVVKSYEANRFGTGGSSAPFGMKCRTISTNPYGPSDQNGHLRIRCTKARQVVQFIFGP